MEETVSRGKLDIILTCVPKKKKNQNQGTNYLINETVTPAYRLLEDKYRLYSLDIIPQYILYRYEMIPDITQPIVLYIDICNIRNPYTIYTYP